MSTRRSELMDNGRIVAPETGIHVMSAERSIDIDEPLDFEFAEFIMRKQQGDAPADRA